MIFLLHVEYWRFHCWPKTTTVSAKLNWMAYSELPWSPFLGHQAWSWTILRRGNVFYYVYKLFFVFLSRFLTFFYFYLNVFYIYGLQRFASVTLWKPFIPGLKPSSPVQILWNPSHRSLPFLLPGWLRGFPGLFLRILLSISVFHFLVFLFSTCGRLSWLTPAFECTLK